MYRKILSYLIAVLFYFVLVSQSHAVSVNFVKDAQNPLQHDFFALQSTVAKRDNQYEMWFTGHNGSNLKLGYATSTNGSDWPSSTFVSVNDTGDNHDPSLFVNGGNKYIYYVSEPSEGSGVDIKIKRAVANGSQFSTPQLINLPRQPWNSQKLSCPFGYFENGTYFLFYCGTAGGGWDLGLASSQDGINFTPCANNPVVSGGTIGNSQLYTGSDGLKHLLFHSDNGVEEMTSSGALGCNSVWSDRKGIISKDRPYDQSQIIAPSLVTDSSPMELFYTAQGPATSGTWKLNRAVEKKSKPKIVIVPGFFASWNQNAVLHNKIVGQGDWKIPSYIQEYKGLISTLENLGLVADRDFFIFPYDWRRSINTSTQDLKSFLQTKIWNVDQTAQVNLVGHSMGGVVSRIYAQKYPNDNVAKVVTAGAPQRGVVQVYWPLEAGETQKDDTLLWFGTKLLININRKLLYNDRKTVQTVIPSLFDLFPTFDFLKNSNGTFKPISSLTIQNSLLNSYSDLGPLVDKMTVIYGNKSSTNSPLALEIGSRAVIDKLMGDYADGRPIKTFSGPGDYLVPVVSSAVGINTQELRLDHGELIYSKDAVKKILDALAITYQESNIVEGSSTQIGTSLIVTVQSPIEVSVQSGSQTYYPEDGIILIPNAQSGTYTLNVKKLAPGDYTVTVAQIAQQNDVWERFVGTIGTANVDEEDRFQIKYDSKKATPQIKADNCRKFRRSPFFFRKKLQLLCRFRKF